MKKIAVPVKEDFTIDDHFGHCSFYGLYVIENNEVKNKTLLPSVGGCGCKSGIATTLAAEGVSLMLAGGIGAGAVEVLKAHHIDVIRGCTGHADELVERFLKGELHDDGVNCAHHHDHSH
jgi:predicted Fe-Mo cluster-binding NifX family protein